MSKISASDAVVVANSGFSEAALLANAIEMLVSARLELLLFVAAMISYFVLFMQKASKKVMLKGAESGQDVTIKKRKAIDASCKEEDYPADAYTRGNVLDPVEYSNVEKALQLAFESDDYRGVLRCWSTTKTFARMPLISLPHVVESMQRFKKDVPFILRELKHFFVKYQSECSMSMINDLLESLAKRFDSELMQQIVEMLPSINFAMDERSYEVFLDMYFTMRNFQEVKAMIAQMTSQQITFTARSSMVAMKTALKLNNFEEAVQSFRDLKRTWTAHRLSSTPSMAPTHVVSQLVELACRDHRLGEFLPELYDFALSEEVVNSMLTECVRQKDSVTIKSVEKLARAQDLKFTDATYSLLIKGLVGDPSRVQVLLDEVVEKGVEVTSELLSSVLGFCTQTSNIQMADKLYGYMKPKQAPVVSAFIRFFAETDQCERACDVYEHVLAPLLATAEDTSCSVGQRRFGVDVRMERILMNAALKCGRGHIAQVLLDAAPSDIAKHINMIRNCASNRDLQGAISIFDSLERSRVDLNSVVYNTVLDACVECRDLEAAEAWMHRTKKAGMADVVSFNTLIKIHLQTGGFEKARQLMTEMVKEGLQPNRVTFNELINAVVSKGGAGRRKQMWDIVNEMKIADVKPNRVTLSILLKSLGNSSTQQDILKTMDLINTMDEAMDEVLLSSVVEACVRIGKPDLLESQLNQLQKKGCSINGSHTYGSLIKAYGHAKDVDNIWRCWKEMRSRLIKPTSVTLGCMIEAIVSTGDTEGAYDLLHQVQEDEHCHSAINSVMYCSVLKGFSRERKMDRALAVYQEINTMGIELSAVMYNTLIDACARCGRMEHLDGVLADMRAHKVRPNIITYSTMLKGYCQNGDIQTGFSILEQIKKDPQLKPDEIMYNSLLDGCARNSLVDEGLRLVQEMQAERVQPSNYTLSILVKLLSRARRLDQAFSIVTEISQRYNFRVNEHVYANLVQGCVSSHQLSRGMRILEQMVSERVVPDGRTYSTLIRASLSKGLFDQAAELLKGALGLPDAPEILRLPTAVCSNLDHALINEALFSLAERGQSRNLAIPLLSNIRKHAPKVRINEATQRKVMSDCLPSDRAERDFWHR